MQENAIGEFNKNELDVLELLRAELDFMETGGRRSRARTPRPPASPFQDSPICINFEDPARNHPCDECLLMELVPTARRAEKVPCQHIPVTEDGKTLDDLGRYRTRKEIEVEVKKWLRRMIATLEGVRGNPSS